MVRSSRISRALAPEYGPAYRQGFAELPAQVQRDVLQRVTAAHAALGRSTEVTEVLIWQAHARQDALEGEKEAVERAERWTLAWSALVEDGLASPSPPRPGPMPVISWHASATIQNGWRPRPIGPTTWC